MRGNGKLSLQCWDGCDLTGLTMLFNLFWPSQGGHYYLQQFQHVKLNSQVSMQCIRSMQSYEFSDGLGMLIMKLLNFLACATHNICMPWNFVHTYIHTYVGVNRMAGKKKQNTGSCYCTYVHNIVCLYTYLTCEQFTYIKLVLSIEWNAK